MINRYRIFLYLPVILAATCFLVVACRDRAADQQQKKTHIVVARRHSPLLRLYYAGVLSPLKMQSVLSPVEGRITQINFSYGQFANKGQKLLAISSGSLTQSYRKSISDYLEKKSAYANSTEAFQGTEALYKMGVISRQEYVTSRSQYQLSRLNFYESQYEMEKTLQKAGLNPKDIERLTLGDTTKINKILKRQFKNIVVHANANGIILFPLKNATGSSENPTDSSNQQLQLGSGVKQEQLLLSIGDLRGLSTKIFVNEVNINRMKKGMDAVVTGSAFPNIRLKAYVAAVSSQARTTGDGRSLSEFPVLIKVPKLTTAERQIIHVGMTAKVEIEVKKQASIMLPIAAVFQRDGQAMVTRVDSKGQQAAIPVTTGFTTLTQVSINSGIHPGDRILVPGSAMTPGRGS